MTRMQKSRADVNHYEQRILPTNCLDCGALTTQVHVHVFEASTDDLYLNMTYTHPPKVIGLDLPCGHRFKGWEWDSEWNYAADDWQPQGRFVR